MKRLRLRTPGEFQLYMTAWVVIFISYLTNTFHLAVRVYSDDAQMTSKHGKNKEVGYEPQASSVTVCCSYHVLTSSVRYQSTHAPLNGIYLFYTLFGYGPAPKNCKLFKKNLTLTICTLIEGKNCFLLRHL